MSGVLKDLQPKNVFKYFEIISQIPRCSGNEKEISDYMVSFAKDLGHQVIQDSVNNIIIKKKASKGYENSETIILQGHLDMVGEKDSDSDHDFDKDGLDLYLEGDKLAARGTTLGADNGIAIAYQMALLADDSLKHPPLEMFMTIDEERGMTGVSEMDLGHLDGKILINLDSETEGEFLTSCAGGIRTSLEIKLESKKASPKNIFYRVDIKGLKGGHSGIEIILERANSNILMGRFLQDLREKMDFELVSIDGGTMDNVITRETKLVIGISPSDSKDLEAIASKWEDIFRKEYRLVDPDITIDLSKLSKSYPEVFTETTKNTLISALVVHPYGVQSMSKDMEGLVETSLNLGVVNMVKESIVLSSSVRSSSASRKGNIVKKIEELAKLLKVDFIKSANYPAWEFDPDSKIREKALEVYKKHTGQEASINAIHAGLECGFLSEKLPGVDMVSFGPNISGAHTSNESVSVKSVKNVWEFLLLLLEELK